jgi:hypothetical protein
MVARWCCGLLGGVVACLVVFGGAAMRGSDGVVSEVASVSGDELK